MTNINRDLHHNIAPVVGLKTQVISTDTTTAGEVIDLQGVSSIEFTILSGTITDGTYAPLLEEANKADFSDNNDVAPENILGTVEEATFTDADGDTVKKIGYKVGAFRYVRLSLISVDTTTGGTFSAIAIKGNPALRPV